MCHDQGQGHEKLDVNQHNVPILKHLFLAYKFSFDTLGHYFNLKMKSHVFNIERTIFLPFIKEYHA